MLPTLDIKKALLLKNHNEIIEQINNRKHNISEMLGWLYPSIIQAEIDQLYKRLKWLRDPPGNFDI
jgi:hypothetical protein